MASDQELAEADREFEAINQPMTEEEKAHWAKVVEEYGSS